MRSVTSFLPRVSNFGAALAVVLAGATAAPTPARASNDDVLRFLLGAAAVAVIVHSFTAPPRAPVRQYGGSVLPDHCLETLRVRGRHIDVYNAACLERAGVRHLPGHCAQTVRTDRGERRVFGESCLHQAGFRPEPRSHPPRSQQPPAPPHRALLPEHCETSFRHRGERDRGYDPACLSRAGFRNLPGHCALEVRGDRGGYRWVYSARCLTDAGFREERRGRR